MHVRLSVSIGLIALTVGCRVPAVTNTKPAPVKPAASALVAPTTAVTKLAPPSFLRTPAEKSLKLTGQVVMDALYATSVAGGSRLIGKDGKPFIGADGAKVISNDGGTLITNDGGSLISNDGGGIIAQGGGNVISPNGSTIIAQGGGNIIAQGGGNLVAGGRIIASGGGNIVVPASLIGNDGGTAISQDGATLIGKNAAAVISNDGGTALSKGPASYQLAQAPGAPAFGETWPAAGMWLSAVDVRTGLTVPLGKDDAGKNVFAIYTDADGKFAVNVAADLAPHVRLVARAPGRTDRRTVLTALIDPKQVDTRMDDDADAVISFLRYAIARQLLGVLGVDLGDGGATYSPDSNSKQTKLLIGTLGDVQTKVKTLGLDKYDAPHRLELGLALADRLLADIDLRAMTLQDTGSNLATNRSKSLIGRPMLEELTAVLRRLRTAATLAAAGHDPAAYFAAKPYLIEANFKRAPGDQYVIERAADLPEFLVREYLSAPLIGQTAKSFDVIQDLGLPLEDRDRMSMAGQTMVGALGQVLLSDPSRPASKFLFDYVSDISARLGDVAIPAPAAGHLAPPVPTAPPLAPAMEVTTVAGAADVSPESVAAGAWDGPGPMARFAGPRALAVGPDHALYVADEPGHSIRRLTFDASGLATVVTVAGQELIAGNVSGLGNKARFNRPSALAFDHHGHLYVADPFNYAIRRLTFASDGSATVETVLGPSPGDQKTYKDGDANTATMGQCYGLAVDPDDNLVFTDFTANALRKLTFSAGGNSVSTLINASRGTRVDTVLAEAKTASPGAVAITPDGTIYWAEFSTSALRRIDAPITKTSESHLVAGGRGTANPLVAFWSGASFRNPTGLAFDAQGNILMADAYNNMIRQIRPDGWSQTLAGGGLPCLVVEGPPSELGGGYLDGVGLDARFRLPTGIVVDGNTIFISDKGNNTIRRLRPR